MKNNLVYKSNDLVNARYEAMTLNEQILILSAISSVDPRTLDGTNHVDVTVPAFADLADIKHHDVYNDLKEAVNRLFTRYAYIENPEPGVNAVKTRWVSSIEYLDDKATIRLYFAQKILPYLSQLNSNFTAYRLKYVANFTSKYGIRLFELLMQWQTTGEREITIEKFRDIFVLGDKYNSIKDLKQRVLKPALNDINTHSNMAVKMGQRKRGRRVAAFQFTFSLKTEKNKRKKLTKAHIEKFARPG